MTKHITGHDVARMAGVSQATVSRALRNLPGTSPQTRTAVLAAAASLNYVPSDNGRALSTRQTHRVALVVEDLTNPFYPQLVEPLRRELLRRGLRAVLITESHSEPDQELTLEQLMDGSYDGAVLTTTRRRSRLPRDLTERGMPHVLVNRVLDQPESPSCTFDNSSGARQAANLLASLGHRRVVALNGPVDTSTGRERASALATALREVGIALPRAATVRAAFDHQAGFEGALKLLTRQPRPTALVCGNDVLALGALSAARSLGIEVPRELTVIGFDDIVMAAWPLVDLTTIHCDLGSLAKAGVTMLVDSLSDGWESHDSLRLPVSLVERHTHAPAPP